MSGVGWVMGRVVGLEMGVEVGGVGGEVGECVAGGVVVTSGCGGVG